jgi:hypothetical protein
MNPLDDDRCTDCRFDVDPQVESDARDADSTPPTPRPCDHNTDLLDDCPTCSRFAADIADFRAGCREYRESKQR